MKISICIPTYKRIAKLERCLESVFNQTYKNFEVCIIIDNDDDDSYYHFIEYAKGRNLPIRIKYPHKHQYGPGCWQWYLQNMFDKCGDIFLGLVDDAELHNNCLEEMVKTFKENFEGTNGAVGLSQMCPGRDDYTWKEFGQMGIGRELIESFPDNVIVCPDYTFLYQDQEFYNYLVATNKFKLSESAVLNHYHPAFKPEEMDDTHRKSRGNISNKDRSMYERRQAAGLIWGKTFELLGDK